MQATTGQAVSVRATESPRRSPLSRLMPYLLVAPTLVLVGMFTLYPSVQTVIQSLMRPGRRPSDAWTFVGFDNYASLFDPAHFIGSNFSQIMVNTVIFAVATVGVSVPLALAFALLLNRRIRALGLWRFSLFYPALLPMIGVGSIWAFIYSDTVGLANTILQSFGFAGVNWIGDPNMVLASVTFVNIWKQSGYYMLFYLAGLQGIPKDMYEAAELDGANYWQQLLYLTLPMLRRTTLFVLVVNFVFAFQTVEHLQVLGQGTPGNRGNLLLYYIFQNIPERRNWGYTNAMSLILVAIVLIFTVTNFIYFERGGREDD